jgi:two-component sensor histidine kinase
MGSSCETQFDKGAVAEPRSSALDRHQILLKEITHRVKNSLQVVISMLHLQSSASNDATLGAQLAEASSRVSAIGRA